MNFQEEERGKNIKKSLREEYISSVRVVIVMLLHRFIFIYANKLLIHFKQYAILISYSSVIIYSRVASIAASLFN